MPERLPLASPAEVNRRMAPWQEREHKRYEIRLAMFTGLRKLPAGVAEAWADRLTLRDQERDDRRACIECKHMAGNDCRAGLGVIPNLLIRCKAFTFQAPT